MEIETERRAGITLTQEQGNEIVDKVYEKVYTNFSLEVGRSVLRALRYVVGAAFAYAVYVLAGKGAITTEDIKEIVRSKP